MLQPCETRLALRVEDDDLAVDDAALERKRVDRARDLGKDRGVVVAVAGEEERFVVGLAGDEPVAIELELEQPAVARERLV